MLISAIYAPAQITCNRSPASISYALDRNPQLQLIAFSVHANSTSVDKAGCSLRILSEIANSSL